MTDKERKEMEKLQYEAAERVREMSRRAQNPISSASSMPPMPSFVQTPYNSKENHQDEHWHNQSSQSPKHSPSSGFSPPFEEKHQPKFFPIQKQNKGFDILNMLNLKNLKMDNDIMLIIMMVLILSSETSDELLLLALVYIML